MAIRRNTLAWVWVTAKKVIYDTITGKNDALTNIFAAFAKTGKTRVPNPANFGSGFS